MTADYVRQHLGNELSRPGFDAFRGTYDDRVIPQVGPGRLPDVADDLGRRDGKYQTGLRQGMRKGIRGFDGLVKARVRQEQTVASLVIDL